MYNRSINAVVIGHILNGILVYMAVCMIHNGLTFGAAPFALAILSFAAAYLHESALLAMMLENVKSNSKLYSRAYRLYRAAGLACPAFTVLGYLVLFYILIFGV